MVVERSVRRCLLCRQSFTGRAFVCRPCADRYHDGPIPLDVLRTFYNEVDREYPDWANTFGNYNPPQGILDFLRRLDHDLEVLEVGAGGGFFLQELWGMGFLNLTGSDITVTALGEMRRREIDINVVAADAEALPFANRSFDVVVSSDVIEHLPRVNSHLSEVHRILRPGGYYLFKTPNRPLAETYYRVRGLYDYHIWHPSMFSAREIRSLLHSYGFTTELLTVDQLTAAQLRKIPGESARRLMASAPIGWMPAWLHPHLEIAALKI